MARRMRLAPADQHRPARESSPWVLSLEWQAVMPMAYAGVWPDCSCRLPCVAAGNVVATAKAVEAVYLIHEVKT